MRKAIWAASAAAMALVSTAAWASFYVNPDGTGFVGKGDVQYTLGLNNAQVQTANLQFSVVSSSDTTWDCYNSSNEHTQQRLRTVSTQGLLDGVARVRNQITGYNLMGYQGTPTTSVEGPALDSCPNSNGSWSYVEGSDVTTPNDDSALYVNGVLLQSPTL
jgi:hypothetical protein